MTDVAEQIEAANKVLNFLDDVLPPFDEGVDVSTSDLLDCLASAGYMLVPVVDSRMTEAYCATLATG